ncbi:MAG: GTPase HflX [Elusimicrobia bacterium RIFOXYB2_FULL_62_6]|nr:MAG: GTPase HflX [Elusimicrobia bacterium RIFOXYB2_FULL_62_6]
MALKTTLIAAELKRKAGARAAAAARRVPLPDDGTDPAEALEELARLAETADLEVLEKFVIRLPRFNPATLIGSGKVEELKQHVADKKPGLIIFDEELTPAQQRNLEKELGIPVIDRTYLILEIFSRRARTREGKLQVRLARFSYDLTHLTGRGTAMGQQHGMIGTRGPGERQLEYDRRTLRDKITALEKELDAIRRERATQRANRDAVPMPQAAIVGYTNSGKSTLLNWLTAQKHLIYADDKLFATLDPTTKRVRLPGGWALFTDTVGFIQKLPHNLVAAFSSTLEETAHADLILHLHDLSSPQLKLQHEAVRKTLKDLNLGGIPVINVYNKMDAVPDHRLRAEGLRRFRPVFVSARTGEGVPELLARVEAALRAKWGDYELVLEADRQKLISDIYKNAMVKNAVYDSGRVTVSFRATRENYKRILKLSGQDRSGD